MRKLGAEHRRAIQQRLELRSRAWGHYSPVVIDRYGIRVAVGDRVSIDGYGRWTVDRLHQTENDAVEVTGGRTCNAARVAVHLAFTEESVIPFPPCE